MLGNRIRQIREENDMTQEQLAQKMDKSQKTISSWEKDRTSPKMKDLNKLCMLFGCTMEHLTGVKQHDAKDITFKDVVMRLNSFDRQELMDLRTSIDAILLNREKIEELLKEKKYIEKKLLKYEEYFKNSPTPGEGEPESF